MPKHRQYDMTVVRVRDITPNMRRVTLGGEHYGDFPSDSEGCYVKLCFATDDDSPLMRTYTIRHQRHEAMELDIDFALHGDNGLASAWAMHAQPGETLRISAPGPAKIPETGSDWYFLAGDMTALPALSVNLEQLPADATGYAVIEVTAPDDKQMLSAPKGIEIHWVINPDDDSSKSFRETIAGLSWLSGEVYVWAACEFESMRALRRYFRQERSVGKREMYISSYWKRGLSEGEHRKVKQDDARDSV
ncbi:siderophore-interacting protein [Pseudomaricurvus alkylphenolicus]|uniref:siderophore-interacting protein n=1 Tax=Pseudomaricurvus alkylphenolicus TaxID=1306991 RepID=UPI001421A862|nr:siderophore-interacting protein [Pseudomaricurvus alkylphenolicus]NIB38564.1 siderophore-interacting protein [Pseudomaricurvus alkylphenolicus]